MDIKTQLNNIIKLVDKHQKSIERLTQKYNNNLSVEEFDEGNELIKLIPWNEAGEGGTCSIDAVLGFLCYLIRYYDKPAEGYEFNKYKLYEGIDKNKICQIKIIECENQKYRFINFHDCSEFICKNYMYSTIVDLILNQTYDDKFNFYKNFDKTIKLNEIDDTKYPKTELKSKLPFQIREKFVTLITDILNNQINESFKLRNDTFNSLLKELKKSDTEDPTSTDKRQVDLILKALFNINDNSFIINIDSRFKFVIGSELITEYGQIEMNENMKYLAILCNGSSGKVDKPGHFIFKYKNRYFDTIGTEGIRIYPKDFNPENKEYKMIVFLLDLSKYTIKLVPN